MTGSRAGIVQSMAVKAQRIMLDEIGRDVGSPVLYLKSAWADPVLYGGRGERTGLDIDVLVRPASAPAFGWALEARGFRKCVLPWCRATMRFAAHAWTYVPPPGLVPVDLHVGLEARPWWTMDAHACIDRTVAYDSLDGPILSLCAEDQMVFAVLHYARHGFGLDQRHISDMARLIETRALDWAAVQDRARWGGLLLPLFLFAEALRSRGAGVPALRWPTDRLFALRLRHARGWVATAPELRRTRPRSRVLDEARLAVLSGRPSAFPRHVARFALLRTLDLAWELLAPR